MQTTKRRVAIACQGGGSHTAFTAGVLSRLLQPDVLAENEIVGLSGTSGGAICATLAWSTLLSGRPQDAEELLSRFWMANSARTPAEQAVNTMLMWSSRLAETVALPATNPYQTAGAEWGTRQLIRMLDDVVDLTADQELALELGAAAPLLLLGAVDVVHGSFRAFDSRRGEISTLAILASAAIPTLFRSVRIGDGRYWDGLFSQNPPVGALQAADPDEIWVIQINPTSIEQEPTLLSEITARRNELSGNLSLNQELRFIETLDRWLEDGTITSETIHHVGVRVLEMKRVGSMKAWGYSSKLNRDPAFIRELVELGRSQAGELLQAIGFEQVWQSGDRALLVDQLTPDALVSSTHPDAPLTPTRDRAQIRAYFDECNLSFDTSRKRVCQEQVRWDIRSTGASRRPGKVFATFEDGAVTRLTFTA